jgi:hypothetical protein
MLCYWNSAAGKAMQAMLDLELKAGGRAEDQDLYIETLDRYR